MAEGVGGAGAGGADIFASYLNARFFAIAILLHVQYSILYIQLHYRYIYYRIILVYCTG